VPSEVSSSFLRGGAAGFTLVEILIVVVILGVMAAIVVPQYAGARREVEQGAFVNDIRVFTDAAALYQHENPMPRRCISMRTARIPKTPARA